MYTHNISKTELAIFILDKREFMYSSTFHYLYKYCINVSILCLSKDIYFTT